MFLAVERQTWAGHSKYRRQTSEVKAAEMPQGGLQFALSSTPEAVLVIPKRRNQMRCSSGISNQDFNRIRQGNKP